MNQDKQLYSIGQASDICDVTTRTLRFYEIKGLIKPDHISEGGYRYYTMATLRRVQVIRYFVEEGFSLEVAKVLLGTNSLDDYERIFREKMDETRERIYYYQNRLESLKGWYELICDGNRVRMMGDDNVTLKHIPTNTYMFMDGYVDVDDMYSEARLETSHVTLAKSNGHSLIDVGGAYILHTADFSNRIMNTSTEITLIQEAYPNTKRHENIRKLEGFMAVSAYHLGNLANIKETYKRATKWAGERNIELVGDSYERYVIDFYTSDNPDDYVTEIWLPVKSDAGSYNYLNDR